MLNVSFFLQERIRAGKERLATKRMAEENERKRYVSKLAMLIKYFVLSWSKFLILSFYSLLVFQF